ncbi:MAG TPA: phage holin family protein [bacterium]|nr:phage holin family protein [bacterium]
MLKRTVHFLANGLVVFLVAKYLEGVSVPDFWIALLASVVIALLNILVKPMLVLLSLPINILTLGFFTWVLDAVIVLLAAYLVPGFSVDTFLTALIFALATSIVSFLLNKLVDLIF